MLLRIIPGMLLFLSLSVPGSSQDMKKFSLYHPEENAGQQIAAAVKEAKAAGKYVFIQVGGNWCVWCARFHEFVTGDPALDSLLRSNFVVYHLNYSPENHNSALLAKYRFPQRFGFPVFLVLDAAGNLLHTQNSEYLEEGKSYNRLKVIEFFKSWSPAAFDPKYYPEQ